MPRFMICASLAMLCSCIPRPSFLQLHGVPPWMKAEIECRVVLDVDDFLNTAGLGHNNKGQTREMWSDAPLCTCIQEMCPGNSCFDFAITVLMVLMTCFLAWRCSSFFFSDYHVVTDFEGNELRFFPIFVVVSVSHTHTLTNWLCWVLRKRTKIPFRRCGRPHAFEIRVLLVLLVVPSEMFSLQIAGSTSCNETHPLQSWLGQSGHAGLWFSSESKYEHTNIFFHFHIYLLKKSLHPRRKTAREWLHSENLATKRSLQKPQLSVRAPAEQNACELFRSKKVKVSELLESSMRNVKSVMRWRWVGGNDVFTLYLLDIDHIRLNLCWFQSLHDKCLYTDSSFESYDLQYIFFAKICAFQIPRSLEKIPLKAHRKERKRRRQDMKVGLSQDRLVMIIVWNFNLEVGRCRCLEASKNWNAKLRQCQFWKDVFSFVIHFF